MQRRAWARGAILAALVVTAGCAESSMVRQGQLEKLQQQQLAQSRQIEEYQTRLNSLDGDNRGVESLLAQSQRQAKVLEGQVSVLKQQLSSATSQLSRVEEEKSVVEKQAEMLTASMRRQGGVTIQPNNSLTGSLPAVNLPDAQVRRDGDVIRVELPTGRLFEPSTARLLSGASQYVASAAVDLKRLYPDQRIGVEGHTDSDRIQNSQWRSNTQLSTGQAMAVHDLLLFHAQFRPEQLMVVGHGANSPIASNATAQGKERNRRIELVIYPERVR